LPRISPSLNRLSTDSPNAPQRRPGVFGEALSSLGDTAQGIGDMFKKANLVAEKTKAQNQLEASMLDIRTRAENDTDISEKRRMEYDGEIGKAMGEASKHITIPEERGLFGLEQTSKADITKAYVNNTFMKKTVASGKAELDVYLHNKKNEFIQAKTFNEKKTAMLERDAKIKEMSDAGFLDPAEATNLRAKQDEDWSLSQVEYDINTNPELAKSMLEDKEYDGVTEEDRVEYLKDAEEAIERRDVEARKNAKFEDDKKQNALINKQIDGQLGIQDVLDYRDGGGDPKFAQSVIDSLKSGKAVAAETQLTTYEGIIQNILDRSKTATEIRTDIFNKLAIGELSESNARHLLFVETGGLTSPNFTSIEEDFLKEEKKKSSPASKPKQNFFGTAWNMIKNATPLGAVMTMGKVIDESKKSQAQGPQILDITEQEIRKQRLLDHPEISGFPVKGRIMQDRFGNRAMVFPDGSIEDVPATGAAKKEPGKESKPSQGKEKKPEEKKAEK